MGVIEDVRKVIQDLVTPDLKAMVARMDALEAASKLKFEILTDRMDSRFNALSAKIDSNHATVINALNIDKRLEAVERNQQSERRAESASVAS